jgi:membrane peptidoglycan carboxypeptidase
VCEPWKLARRLGVTLDKSAMVPSFTLGIADVSPLEMATAYATFAARGVHCDPRPVAQIEDADGNVLKKYPRQCTQELPGPVADAVNDVLRGVVEPGGFGAALNPGQPAAGKTGTVSGNKAVWFDGYTPSLAGAAVVAGANREGTQITLDGQNIGGYTRYTTAGSTTAGPIWGAAFKAIAPMLPDEDFARPSGQDIRGLLMTIPSVGGRTFKDAKRELVGMGFKVVKGAMVDSGYGRGLVAYSAPGAGAQGAAGDTVTLYISDGSPAPKPKPKKKSGGGKKPGKGHGKGHR